MGNYNSIIECSLLFIYNSVMSPEDTLTALINTQAKAKLQNTFMRLTDKEVAVSLKRLEEDIQYKVFNVLPSAKSNRIVEEMRLLKGRVRVPEAKYQQIINHVIAVLQGRSRGNVSSYVKPKSR